MLATYPECFLLPGNHLHMLGFPKLCGELCRLWACTHACDVPHTYQKSPVEMSPSLVTMSKWPKAAQHKAFLPSGYMFSSKHQPSLKVPSTLHPGWGRSVYPMHFPGPRYQNPWIPHSELPPPSSPILGTVASDSLHTKIC